MVDKDFLFSCWKEARDFSIDLCNVNNRGITLGEPGVINLVLNANNLRIFCYTVEDLDTMSCAQCNWSSTVTAFSRQYSSQTSLVENPANTCRIHPRNFDGNSKTDVLRTCNDQTYIDL